MGTNALLQGIACLLTQSRNIRKGTTKTLNGFEHFTESGLALNKMAKSTSQ